MKATGKYLAAAVFVILGAATAFWHAPRSSPQKSPLDLSLLPLQTLSGEEIHYSDLSPSPRLVNFWATWCAPCVHEMPRLNEAAKSNPNIHFSGIGIDSPVLLKPFLSQLSITYDIYTPKFNIFALFEQTGNKNGVLPYTLLLDAKGEIIATKIGEFHSTDDINGFISENLP